jgi:propanol-preferring alcohol dehydrogenase
VGREIDGGYAEYIKLPAKTFLKLPEALDYKAHPAEIGVVTDAIATPVKLINKARVQPGETVAVIGAGGGLGLHMVMVAKWAKARVIAVDVRPEKFDACRKAGADEIVDAAASDMTEAVLELTNGKGVDVITDFVATGKTLDTAARALSKGGRLAILGGAGLDNSWAISGNLIKAGEREIIGSKYATKDEVRAALEIVARGELWPIVTETCALEDVEALHQRVEQGLVTGRGAVLIGG